jgi:hypothetical protein
MFAIVCIFSVGHLPAHARIVLLAVDLMYHFWMVFGSCSGLRFRVGGGPKDNGNCANYAAGASGWYYVANSNDRRMLVADNELIETVRYSEIDNIAQTTGLSHLRVAGGAQLMQPASIGALLFSVRTTNLQVDTAGHLLCGSEECELRISSTIFLVQNTGKISGARVFVTADTATIDLGGVVTTYARGPSASRALAPGASITEDPISNAGGAAYCLISVPLILSSPQSRDSFNLRALIIFVGHYKFQFCESVATN